MRHVRRARILYAMGFAADWPVNPAVPNFRAADEPLLAVYSCNLLTFCYPQAGRILQVGIPRILDGPYLAGFPIIKRGFEKVYTLIKN